MGYSVELPLVIWRDDTPLVSEPAMQPVRVVTLTGERIAVKLALVILYDPVALPPVALKPVAVLLTEIEPGLNITLVGEAPDHCKVKLMLSLPTFDAKLAHEFVPLVVSLAVTPFKLTALPLDVQPLRATGLIVLFSFAVPFGVNAGLKASVAVKLEQLTIPGAALVVALAEALTAPTMLARPVASSVAVTPIASFFTLDPPSPEVDMV
jgi:hypothetical protein